MKRQVISGAILSVALFMVNTSASAATISIDLDVVTPGIQNTFLLNVGEEFAFDVVYIGDGQTQFDTFALNIVYNNAGQVLTSNAQQPVAGPIADSAPLMALDIFNGSAVNSGDPLSPGSLPVPLGFDEGLGGIGLSSVGGMAFPQLADGEAISLFHSSFLASSEGTSLLELTGYPFGVNAELSLGGNGVPVDLQGASVTVVPLPAAVWLFVTGLLTMFGIGHGRALRKENNQSAGSTHRWLIAVFVLASPLGHAAPLANADLNGDVLVNSLDISKLSSCFLQDPASNSDCIVADVDSDGDIDTDDFSFVSAHFGEALPWILYPSPVFSTSSLNEFYSSALGDVNKDGIPDMVVIDWYWESSILVLSGKGDGRFQLLHRFKVDELSAQKLEVSLADLNKDDILDLVLISDNGISVLFGNGDGSFQTQQHTTAVENPSAVSFGDMNGDSNLDLVVVSEESGEISVLFGNGNGSFTLRNSLPLAGDPNSVVIGDLNNDGALDLVVSNGSDNYVSALTSNGDGTGFTVDRFAVGEQPTSLILGELNGDGIPDLVVANATSNDVSVLLGIEHYTFATEQRYSTGYGPSSVDLADINGDDTLDLVIANPQTNDISMFLGNGDGSFNTEQRLATGREPRKASFTDLDGDSTLDLAIAGRRNVFGLLGNGDGSFYSPQQRFAVGDAPTSAVTGDINGDGLLDLAVANGGSNDVSILLGNAGNGFQPQQRFSVGESPDSVVLGDINGDDNLDLATINNHTDISVLIGNGDGTFQPQQRFAAGESPQSLALGDINGDGALDMAVSNRRNYVQVLLSKGDGNFQLPQSYTVGKYPSSLAFGDLNGDSKLDLAVVNGVYDGDVSVLIGNGDGSFQDDQRYYHNGWGDGDIVLGDLDNDGDLDMVIADYISDYVRTMIGNGDGSFQKHGSVCPYNSPRSPTLGDVNGDGILDIAVSHSVFDPYIDIFLGDGKGSILSRQVFFYNKYNKVFSLEDINADGAIDLMTIIADRNEVSVIFNFGNGL